MITLVLLCEVVSMLSASGSAAWSDSAAHILAARGAAVTAGAELQQSDEKAGWQHFNDPGSGITLTCPRPWSLMTPADVRAKTGGRMTIATGTLVFCVSPQDADRNVNVQFAGSAAAEAPDNETARRALVALEPRLSSMMEERVSGWQKVSATITALGGGMALDIVSITPRGGTAMKQRSVTLVARQKAFTITCTAKASDFEEANRSVFGPLLLSVAVK
jgi:hypothetical protein